MIPATTLGIQNPLQPGKPLGRKHQLSTVFLPENFAGVPSESAGEAQNFAVVPENQRVNRTETARSKHPSTAQEKSRGSFWPTVVESLSQIRPLNEPIMEVSTAIAPEIVFDGPGSNKSLVPLEKTAFGELSSDPEMPKSWSSLADLVENSREEIDSEEIVFTPTGFQRQNPDIRDDRQASNMASSPPEDTYSPSVTQPVTVTSPYFAPEPETPENLDAIVNEVYRRIVDRLQIERERNGRFYSGRLPW
jgi:hypothetical protein